MSLLTEASLIVTPNAYKASKLYSVIPNTTLGDLNVVRNTTATRVNEFGLIEVVGLNVPRLDYTSGSASILVERQKTNLFLNSEPTANENSQQGVSYEAFNWGIRFSNCSRYLDNTALRLRYGGTAPASTELTLSCFVIMENLNAPDVSGSTLTGDFSILIAGARTSNNTVKRFGTTNVYRVTGTRTTETTNLTANGILKYTTQSATGFRVVGWQLEVGSNATSYIPTAGTSVTRNADLISKTGISDLINSQQGVLFVEMASLSNDLTNRDITISGTSSNIITLRFHTVSNNILTQVIINNSSVFVGQTASQIQTNFNKIAVRWSLNNFSLWVNGVKYSESLSGGTFAVDSLFNLSISGVANTFSGKIKDFQIYKEALTDTEIINLTT
tara:strand:- start:128 stop:1291 length:1164 start_codon:yes stop_codon:yes gene_type:complete